MVSLRGVFTGVLQQFQSLILQKSSLNLYGFFLNFLLTRYLGISETIEHHICFYIRPHHNISLSFDAFLEASF